MERGLEPARTAANGGLKSALRGQHRDEADEAIAVIIGQNERRAVDGEDFAPKAEAEAEGMSSDRLLLRIIDAAASKIRNIGSAT